MSHSQASNYLWRIASFGGLLWFIGLAIHLNTNTPSFFSEVKLLLFFGIAVITPLSLRLTMQVDSSEPVHRVFRAAVLFHPVVVLMVAISLLLETGMIAAGLALFWLLQTGLIALYGLSQLLPRPTLEAIFLNAGLIYVPISGIWFVSYSAGYALLTFQASIVLLTAVHFVFISMGGLVIIGVIGRHLYGSTLWKLYRGTASIAVVSPALVATGITVTQFSERLWLEAGAVVILASGFLLLSLLCLSSNLPDNRNAKFLIILSCLSLLVTMCLALAYSLGRFRGEWSLSIFQMVRWHGWLNALGFTFCGLLGWNLLAPDNHSVTDREA